MNFHHLAYWQDKALSLAIENRGDAANLLI